ncbi:NADP-dependent oxidoreductase [Bryobacter aggregatus]|uniref:NADP-dependent oxidoreductase n=1 Tax=Bryobacter aggregatus TaxID=360054 RepID=UPI0004E19658|nr:NADP-dependent oxidoreductase [Bryobacter aggregatus]
MKAARIHSYGGIDAVRIDEIDVPTPGTGELLIKVTAAAVNPVDWKIREGFMRDVLPIEFPHTLGCDISGTVEALGPGTSQFEVGDPVFGYPNLLRCGAFAEYVLVYEAEMAHAPKSIPLADTAGLPVASITAWDGLFTHGKLQAGEKVLILGGSGGVGSLAIQLALWKGARVFATASARNQDLIRDLGAVPIDYHTQATTSVVQNVDLIFDCVGPESGIAALPSLRQGGTYVSSVYALPAPPCFAPYEARSAIYGIQPSGERIREIAKLVDLGVLRILIDTTFALHEVPQALAASQSGRTRGKLLIRP